MLWTVPLWWPSCWIRPNCDFVKYTGYSIELFYCLNVVLNLHNNNNNNNMLYTRGLIMDMLKCLLFGIKNYVNEIWYKNTPRNRQIVLLTDFVVDMLEQSRLLCKLLLLSKLVFVKKYYLLIVYLRVFGSIN